MRKKAGAILCVVLLLALAACGSAQPSSSAAVSAPAAYSGAPALSGAASVSPETQVAVPQTVRVAGLKGPTSMGMSELFVAGGSRNGDVTYDIEVYGTADEIVPKLASGELDAAAIPANLASVLYNKTGGEVVVAAVNTLGVLYVVETGDTVHSVEDLRGKTVYSVGKGTTPEYVLNHILAENGLEAGVDVTVEYKSEATEVAAMLDAGEDVIAVLPQPYVTAVQMKNPAVRAALDLSAEWAKNPENGEQVTGVLVVRKAFAQDNADVWNTFLGDYQNSITYTNNEPEGAARIIADEGIVENEAVAAKALPACHIYFAEGSEMKGMLGGYLNVLYAQNPESVGGALPGDDFYLGA